MHLIRNLQYWLGGGGIVKREFGGIRAQCCFASE